jgi:hypothetical protein
MRRLMVARAMRRSDGIVRGRRGHRHIVSVAELPYEAGTAGIENMVARGGIEPPTRGFSD